MNWTLYVVITVSAGGCDPSYFQTKEISGFKTEAECLEGAKRFEAISPPKFKTKSTCIFSSNENGLKLTR